MHNSASLVILAAGLGSRFGSDKQILKISSLQLPIFAFSLQDAVKNNMAHAVIVTRSELADFFEKDIFPRFPAVHFDLVFQDLSEPKLPENRIKPWGTGHAVLCAADYVRGNFIVMNADDFYGPNAIAATINFVKNRAECCCIGYPLIYTLSPSGPVSRGIIQMDSQNFVTAITEITQIQRQPDGSITSPNIIFSNTTKGSEHSPILWQPQQVVSLNLFGLNVNIFPILKQKFQIFLQKNAHSPTAEFYLPTALSAPDTLNKTITIKMLPTQDRWLGVTYREDLFFLEKQLEGLIADGMYA